MYIILKSAIFPQVFGFWQAVKTMLTTVDIHLEDISLDRSCPIALTACLLTFPVNYYSMCCYLSLHSALLQNPNSTMFNIKTTSLVAWLYKVWTCASTWCEMKTSSPESYISLTLTLEPNCSWIPLSQSPILNYWLTVLMAHVAHHTVHLSSISFSREPADTGPWQLSINGACWVDSAGLKPQGGCRTLSVFIVKCYLTAVYCLYPGVVNVLMVTWWSTKWLQSNLFIHQFKAMHKIVGCLR